MSRSALLSLALTVFISACSAQKSENPLTGSELSPAANTTNVSLNKGEYPVFPNPDAGADPSVPAEMGGKGFKGEGWETNTDFDLIGDPRALKGGTLRDQMISFPGTLRMGGPEWNTSDNYWINSLVYEQLLTLHPSTLQYMPALATHWKVDSDKLTFRFRIDPNARFSDGTPVTSEDVISTWKFLTDKTLQDLYFYTQYSKLEMPVAESKYIVRMKAKELGWENFLIAATTRVFPAHVLKNITGASYLTDYNFKLIPGTGPYALAEADINKGKSITLRRRKDYWAEKYRANIGQYNIDELKRMVVRDENLAIEMLKKGDLDYYYVAGNPQVWVERFNTDAVQRGILVKKSVFNNYPAPFAFIAFNMRRKPFDDIRIRKALTLLFNREQIIEKLFHGLYKPINSYFPGTVYENPNNPKNTYNPEEAFKLLADAGWKDRDSQGRLTKNGQPLQIEVLYARQVFEPWLTIFQEDLRRVGITLNLRLVTFETAFKLEMQRQFDYAVSAWGAGSVFPSPRPEYHSETADVQNTNNITGIKDKKIDEIINRYDLSFDSNERAELLKQLDGLLANLYSYTPRWYDPAQRIVFWNRFGMPHGIFSRVGDHEGTLAPGIPQLWWVDPQKSQKVAQGMRDNSVKMDITPEEDHYWQERYGQAQKEMEAQTKRQ
jgi:microcin C transport system substrate-binding protein